jgi:hypothetical protein
MSFEFRSWSEVRSAVHSINKEAYELLESIVAPDDEKLILATYNYTDLIVKQGQFNIESAPPEMAQHLNYDSIPLFLVLNNWIEVFLENEGVSHALTMFKPGEFIGIFEFISTLIGKEKRFIRNLSAGVRTCFLLNKIRDQVAFQKLKHNLQLDNSVTNEITWHNYQWKLFKIIQQKFCPDWQVSVLILPRAWVNKIAYDQKWLKFKSYLQNFYWWKAEPLISQRQLDFVWQGFINLITQKNYKFKPYIYYFFQEILKVAEGISPGFIPVTHECFLPYKEIQEIMIKLYKIEYYPDIMQIAPLDILKGENILYSSLKLLANAAEEGRFKGKIQDHIDVLKVLLSLFRQYVKKNFPHEFKIDKLQIDFFNPETDPEALKKAISEDPSFNQAHYQQLRFCDTSFFWKGAIRFKCYNNSTLK